MKVDFLIAGTQKGGTTTLDAYLRSHSKIQMANMKEVHFFDNEAFFEKCQPDYDQYHRNFPSNPCGEGVRYGESTPIYMYWRSAPSRIFKYNPNIRLIILLRNPIERAHSHWNMERNRNNDPASFYEAITSEIERCKAAHPYQHRIFSYAERGLYAAQLLKIYEIFPKDQVLVLRSDDLYRRPQQLLDQVCDFLDVARISVEQSLHLNAFQYISPIGAEEWELLKEIFESDIMLLEELTGWDCSDWLRPPNAVIDVR